MHFLHFQVWQITDRELLPISFTLQVKVSLLAPLHLSYPFELLTISSCVLHLSVRGVV